MNILLTASECSPLVKVGGIADVVGSLPIALNKLGVDIRVCIPFYKPLLEYLEQNKGLQVNKIETRKIEYGKQKYAVTLYQTYIPNTNITVYLLYNKEFISNGGVYYSPAVLPSPEDEITRFAFFSKSIVEFFSTPNNFFFPDIIHCNDWHTAIVPQLIKLNAVKHSSTFRQKTVLTIHNLAFQGFTKSDVATKLGLDINLSNALKWDLADDNLDLLLQGLITTDFITTVSETYANEIQTPEYGEGLDEILLARQDNLTGIINGISYEIFSPETDKYIYSNFSKLNTKQGKAANKKAFREAYGLEASDKPLVCLISRLAYQKGLDLILNNIKEIIKMGYQVVILGTGDPQLESFFQSLNEDPTINKNYKAFIEFSEEKARKIYAASDFILIPSRYEPCGLTQLIAMAYGTIPIARATGGLFDTVKENKTGYLYQKNTSENMVECLYKALRTYKDKNSWDKIVLNAIKENFSWNESAKKYSFLYKKVMAKQHI